MLDYIELRDKNGKQVSFYTGDTDDIEEIGFAMSQQLEDELP
jgi:hypothetical protein